jgi:uncharacterized integral membrane protein
MRLLFTVLLLILVLGMLGFFATNLQTTVPVTIWNTVHPDVHIFFVVLLSVLVGVVFTTIIAIAEGAKIRLDNRRLRREIHKLESEINYLRTQPPSAPRPEPDALTHAGAGAATVPAPEGDAGAEPPSAPVYGTDLEDWSSDPDDDAYTGGRAV